MDIATPADLGRLIRERRKEEGLTLQQAAAICGVSYAFLSALENGKATARLNKILNVLRCLGIRLTAEARGWGVQGEGR